MNATPRPTVVVPVYRGVDEVARCLESVLRHADGAVPFELLIIDDDSPETAISDSLARLESEPAPAPITVLRNDENLGFVRSVNRGIRRAGGDVVILNADTVVTSGWLDRLAAAASQPDVATVTPLTNSGSICTLPRSIIDAFDLEGTNPAIDECAAFVDAHSLRLQPEVITGVGFCMYVTRRALDLCGVLDEVAFGHGYGEEVDFCLRATRVGFRHLVEDATFVYHRGGVSFGEERSDRLDRASALLHDRYRFFQDANTRERAADPLRVPFVALELGLGERRSDRPHVLHLLHGPPGETGGTEIQIRALLESLSAEFDFSIVFPVESGFVLRTFWHGGHGTPIEREFLLPAAARRVTLVHDDNAAEMLRTALDMFEFDAVHIQNLIGHSLAPMDVLSDFPGPVVCSVHDLYLACPNHSLLYRNQHSCGIPEELSLCGECLNETRALPLTYLEEFRATVSASLDTVDHWVFASQSAADSFLRLYELEPASVELIPHGSTIQLDRPRPEPDLARIFDEPLRLAFVGRGWSKKGLAVANFLADALADSSVEIHHFGEQKDPPAPELHVHGTYDHELLPELLNRAGIQIVLLPGPYAETFGLVMTEALVAGLPVIGARYGALGERIRKLGAGWTIDPADEQGVLSLIEQLDRCRTEVLRATRRARAVPLHPAAEDANRYAALYSTQARDNASSQRDRRGSEKQR